MVGPGLKANGGIVKVIEYYKNYKLFWDQQDIFWIESHCDGSKFRKLIIVIKSIFVLIKKARKAKVVHLHFSGGSSSNRKIIFFVISKFFRLKIVSHLHTPILNFTNIINWSFKTMVKKSDVVIVLSPVFVEALKNKIANREYIILNNPSQGFYSDDVNKEKIILFAGRVEEKKGYHDLINSLALIKSLNHYRVILAGSGEINKAEGLIKKFKLKNVKTVGWLGSKEIIEVFKKSQIFILPSYGEGFPISIIDALSNKCAVITTPVGGIPDFLEDGETCLFFKPGDIEGLADSIERLIKDNELKNKLVENGYTLAKKSFDIGVITKKLGSIYSNLGS